MTSTLVVDANIAVGWSVELPYSAACVRILRNTQSVIAPDLVISEVANAFYLLAKRETADRTRLIDGLELLPRWFAELVPSVSLRKQALEFALKLDHPAYDCFYLTLALMRDVRLVTADAHFARKCTANGFGKAVVALEDWQDG